MKPTRATQLTGWIAETFPEGLADLGRLESCWLKNKLGTVEIRQPVYICGLARAGSTVLLEALAQCPGTISFRYRDFPFVQLPVWWHALSGKVFDFRSLPVERAHGDRIRVTAQSPEAFEELLWMHYFPHAHSAERSQCFDGDMQCAAFEESYRQTLRKLLWREQASRYLAKGNYLVSRIGYLRKLFPDAHFVIPIRHPVSHVASLLRQHERFCRLEHEDPAVLAYMRRAGHFEFGLDRRPINCGDPADSLKIQGLFRSGDDVAGYAEQWRVVYEAVHQWRETSRVHLLHYETLCAAPVQTLSALCAELELPVSAPQREQWAQVFTLPDYYTTPLTSSQVAQVMAIAGETAAAIGCVR